jgi:Tol biopolymer transport system component
MTPRRWFRISELFDGAFELPEAQRTAFLESACGGDAELRAEVERLLAESDRASLHSPASRILAAAAEPAPGETFAHYRIEAKLGEGGMGVIFRARDTRLGRSVVLKFFKAPFSGRGQREARTVAALNHPHICTLHDVGDNYLVMELIEGPTLAERISQSPVPLREALGLAGQVAEALEAAHEKGVVHRDLKPANIKLTAEGEVKVLDFGLAKALEPAEGSPEDSTAPAVSVPGMILGTAAYMSPEQAGGKPVDKRADIWSFGAVLWELLTGRPLFAGETVSHTLAEVLRDPIDFDKLPGETPAAIRGLLRRCLDRNPKTRLRDIGEARITIKATLAGESPLAESTPAPSGGRRSWLAWSMAAAIVGMAAAAVLHFRDLKAPVAAPPQRFQIPVPDQATRRLNLSPDGRKLAFIVGERLWVHSLESGESRDLGVLSTGVPFWSPDSRLIGCLSEGKLKKVAATGGPTQTVVAFSGTWGGGAWSQDDVIVFGDRRTGLYRVPAAGGVPVQITALDPARHENSQFCPAFLPDGRHFVYVRASTDEGRSAIYLGSVDARPDQQSSRPLVTSNSQPAYALSPDPDTGYLLFVREGTLLAQPFDHRRLELRGQAAPVAAGVSDDRRGAIYVGFSAAAGALVFAPNTASDSQLTWYDREGKVTGTIGQPGPYKTLELSPQGTRLAVAKVPMGADASNIFLLDLSRGGASTRVTSGSLIDTDPVWSPDGSRIIFSSNRDGPYNLYQTPANGAKDAEILLRSGDDKHSTSWSRDGRFLLYTVTRPKTGKDLWVLVMDKDMQPVPFLDSQFNESQARYSPDGRWVAYTSDESGQEEVYVRRFSMNAAGTAAQAGGKTPISNGFGADPRWRGDGRELYYRSRDGALVAVEIAATPALRVGSPRRLGVPTFGFWDAAADGRRFLGLANKAGTQPFSVLLNWPASLRK